MYSDNINLQGNRYYIILCKITSKKIILDLILENQVKECDRFVYDVNYILESYRKEYIDNE